MNNSFIHCLFLPHSTGPGKSTCKQARNHRILSFKMILAVIAPPFRVSFPFKALLHKLRGLSLIQMLESFVTLNK